MMFWRIRSMSQPLARSKSSTCHIYIRYSAIFFSFSCCAIFTIKCMNYDFSPSHSIQRFTHQRKHQSHHRHHNDNAPDNTVQHPDATQVELCTDFIDKKVMPNHHAKAPNAMAKYPVTASNTSTPSLTKAKRAKRPTKRNIIRGLESVTANAVMKL